MELPSLHKERLTISQKIEDNEKSIAYLNKTNHWHKKHLRLIDAQIEEAKELEPTAVSDLLDIAKAGLK